MPTTRWIITFGTYASRLHGGTRPTVERPHNKVGEDYVVNQPRRAEYERGTLNDEPVRLTYGQQRFIES